MADKPVRATKRIVKNPETFRERAVKASEAADKPKQAARLKQVASKFTTPVLEPATGAARRLAAWKPFRLISKPLRLIGKIIFPTYFRQSWQELRLVTWPSWHESRRLTYAVLVFAVIFGAVIAGVDYGLDKVFKTILLK